MVLYLQLFRRYFAIKYLKHTRKRGIPFVFGIIILRYQQTSVNYPMLTSTTENKYCTHTQPSLTTNNKHSRTDIHQNKQTFRMCKQRFIREKPLIICCYDAVFRRFRRN